MERFKQIEDGAVITNCRGVTQQRKLFTRGGNLYAAHGSGFIMLYARGTTTVPSVSWKEIDTGTEATGYVIGPMDRLMLPSSPLRIAS